MMNNFTLHKSLVRTVVVHVRERVRTTTGRHLVILCGMSAGFFLLYLWPSFRMPPIFISPDETANYYFSDLIAKRMSLRSPLPFGGAFGASVAPRSTAVVQNSYVPGSFLGLPIITGLIARVFGTWMILAFPVLLASACVPFFYLIVRRFFPPTVSLLSALLLYVHPAFWYFASRPMFHNALFLALLIFGAYCFLRMVETSRTWFAAASGTVLALALWTRTSEVVWVAPFLVLLLILCRRRLSKKLLFWLLGTMAVFGLGLLTINTMLFGSPLGSGYTITTESTPETTIATTMWASMSRFILPFGIHVDRIANTAWQYLYLYIPWFGILATVGTAICIRRVVRKKLRGSQLRFCAGSMIVVFWLLVYYGSFHVQEYSDPNRILPSISYVRYWLPAYALLLPMCAIALQALLRLLPGRRSARTAGVAFLLVIVLASAQSVLLDPLLGLAQVRKTVRTMEQSRRMVERVTEDRAVIVAGYSEKAFFPERLVVVQLPQDPVDRDALFARIFSRTTLYVYRNFADTVSKRDWTTLAATRWSLTPVVRDGDNTLYAVHTPSATIETSSGTE